MKVLFLSLMALWFAVPGATQAYLFDTHTNDVDASEVLQQNYDVYFLNEEGVCEKMTEHYSKSRYSTICPECLLPNHSKSSPKKYANQNDYSITNVQFDPPSPANLEVYERVNIRFNYTKPDGDVRIWATPVNQAGEPRTQSNAGWAPSEIISENSGELERFFLFLAPAQALVLRINIYDIETEETVYDAYFSMDYIFGSPIICNKYQDSLELVKLYSATNGPNWTFAWNLNKPMYEWPGVYLNSDGCVNNLQLNGNPNLGYGNTAGNNMYGNFPDLELPHLEEIRLHYNYLNGTIPCFDGMPNLSTMGVSQNQFSNSCDNYSHLQYLRAAYFSLDASEAVRDISSIDYSNPSTLGIVGPGYFGDLNALENYSLRSLNIDKTHISGEVPEFVNANFYWINISDSKVSGTCPTLASHTGIVAIELESNNLSGPIPDYTNLPNLHTVRLFGNKFTFEDFVDNPHNLDIGVDYECNNIYGCGFQYAPQQKIYTDTTLLYTVGERFELDLGVDQGIEDNEYYWSLNGSLHHVRPGESKLILPSAQANHEGIWTVRVINPRFPDLELESHPIRLTTSSDPICHDTDHPDYGPLMDLYHDTDGTCWYRNDGWIAGAGGVSCDPCNYNGSPWYGLQCVNGRVISIDLDGVADFGISFSDGNNLNGPLPSTIAEVDQLQFLNTYGNVDLTGTIPAGIDNLQKIKLLNLGQCKINDVIPEALYDCTELDYLSFQNCELEGSISPSIIKLSKLATLILSDNNLSGLLPDEMSSMSNISYLFLSNNQFSGNIPSLKNLNKLITLSIVRNKDLEGKVEDFIPEEIQHVYIGRNKGISGDVSFFCDLPNLISLSADYCSISGNIPSCLFEPSNLYTMYLSYNNLSGCIPDGIEKICSEEIRINFLNNEQLPWNGDLTAYCNGESQVGASCDDCDPSTTDDVMTDDCVCKGEGGTSIACDAYDVGPTDPGYRARRCLFQVNYDGQVRDKEAILIKSPVPLRKYIFDFCDGYSTETFVANVIIKEYNRQTREEGAIIHESEGCRHEFRMPAGSDYDDVIILINDRADCTQPSQGLENGRPVLKCAIGRD